MKLQDIDFLCERISVDNVYRETVSTLQELFKDKNFHDRFFDKVSSALTNIAEKTANNVLRWTNKKTIMDVQVTPSKLGGGGTSSQVYKEHCRITHINIQLPLVKELKDWIDGITNKVNNKDEIIEYIAHVFSHEMTHAIQELRVKEPAYSDTKKFNRIKDKTALMRTPEEHHNQPMTDDVYTRYLSTIAEIGAYAGDAARELTHIAGSKQAALTLLKTNDKRLMQSSTYYAYSTKVRTQRPKAWKEFLISLHFNLTESIDESTKQNTYRVYHGTKSDFNNFIEEYISASNDQALGWGFYFTDDKEDAQTYTSSDGGYILECDVTIKKPLSNTKPFKYKDVELLIKNSPNYLDSLANFGDVDYEGERIVLHQAISSYIDNDMLNSSFNIANDFYGKNVRSFLANMIKIGYDGVIDRTHPALHIVAFSPQQVKIINKIKV
jgi:hypothetical protein